MYTKFGTDRPASYGANYANEASGIAENYSAEGAEGVEEVDKVNDFANPITYPETI